MAACVVANTANCRLAPVPRPSSSARPGVLPSLQQEELRLQLRCSAKAAARRRAGVAVRSAVGGIAVGGAGVGGVAVGTLQHSDDEEEAADAASDQSELKWVFP